MEYFTQGKVINNKYRIISLLGKGSMGRVYLVENLKGERFVIKELLPDKTGKMDWQESLEIFRKEAQLIMNFTHPGLPEFFETFSWEDREFLVMEFIEGITLESIISDAKAPLETTEVIDWIIQLCHIMDYLHNSFHTPVVYRDLKPSNIILTNEGKIKLVDFGVARYYNPDKNTDTLSFGTPGYAAPEQYKGKGQSSPLSDIFGLGVIMYQLLTLYDPTVQPFTFPEMKKFNPSISDYLERIIKKALSLNPSERYISMAEFRETLEKYMGINKTAGVTSPPPGKTAKLVLAMKIIGFIIPVFFCFLPIYFNGRFMDILEETFPTLTLIYIGVSMIWIITAFVLKVNKYLNLIFVIIIFIFAGFLCSIISKFIDIPRVYGKLESCESSMKNMATALEMYATDNNGYYPENPNKLMEGTYPYMKSLPSCPKSNQVYIYEVKNGNKSSNFTLYCPVKGSHSREGLSDKDNFPQYSPVRGLITK